MLAVGSARSPEHTRSQSQGSCALQATEGQCNTYRLLECRCVCPQVCPTRAGQDVALPATPAHNGPDTALSAPPGAAAAPPAPCCGCRPRGGGPGHGPRTGCSRSPAVNIRVREGHIELSYLLPLRCIPAIKCLVLTCIGIMALSAALGQCGTPQGAQLLRVSTTDRSRTPQDSDERLTPPLGML